MIFIGRVVAVIDYKGSEKLLRTYRCQSERKRNDCFEFKFTDEGAAKLADMSRCTSRCHPHGQLADNHDINSFDLETTVTSAGTIEPKADPSQYANQVSVSTQAYVNAHVERLPDRMRFWSMSLSTVDGLLMNFEP